MSEDEQIIQCALEQAARDMPRGILFSASIYQKSEDYGPGLATQGKRWYVEIMEANVPAALYRVWQTFEGPKAIQVAILPEAYFENYVRQGCPD